MFFLVGETDNDELVGALGLAKKNNSKSSHHGKVKKSGLTIKPTEPSTPKLPKAPIVTITPLEASSLGPLKLKVSAAGIKPASKAAPAKAATATTSSKSAGSLSVKSSTSKSKKKLPEMKFKVGVEPK